MSVKIARETDGRVSITVTTPHQNVATVTAVEARLLAIKLLLAAEALEPIRPGQ
jgi:hypothetical protein